MKEINVNSLSFEELRTRCDSIYVDKTEYIYQLVNDWSSSYYSIARPHNFGKSLMCSTLQALFEGKRELFKDLYIDSTDYSFEKYPVLHFNFGRFDTTSYESFIADFQTAIYDEAERNGVHIERNIPSEMLYSVLRKLDKKAVIIIDEYDTPIFDTYKNIELSDKIRKTLSVFYSIIKNKSEKIRLFFLTGIKKYVNMSIFSGINNLTDLTFDPNYASAFGYTEEELESNFGEYIDEYIKRDNREYETREEFISAIRDYYDGYRFSDENTVKVYNPVSVGTFFNKEWRFMPYCENTGVSTLAVELAKNHHLWDILKEEPMIGLDVLYTFDYSSLASIELDESQVLALMYFTGYLTILEGDSTALTLAFPNKEVRSFFMMQIQPANNDTPCHIGVLNVVS